jgi:ABC-type phosphate/phosphonate transport system substrate-binding protein
MLALKVMFAPLAEHGRVVSRAQRPRGHLASVAAVREGRADVCAIDAVCVGLLRRYRPELMEGIATIGHSPSIPALPFVTATTRRDDEVQAIRAAITGAFADPALASARNALLITGVSFLERSDYDVIPALEREAEAAGGLHLWADE